MYGAVPLLMIKFSKRHFIKKWKIRRERFFFRPGVIFLLIAAWPFPFGRALAGPPEKPNFYFDIRYRYEYQDNFNLKFYGRNPPAGRGNDGFLLQRIRTGFQYPLCDTALLSVGMQDSRAYDVALPDRVFFSERLELENNAYKDYVEPFETYLLVDRLFGRDLSVKIGRQIITYGDTRVFGPGQWGNTGRFNWDAFRIFYQWNDHLGVDGFWGANIIHDSDKPSILHRHDFKAAGLYSHWDLMPPVRLEPFAVVKYDLRDDFVGESGRGDFKGYFVGARAFGRIAKAFFYDATFVQQWGNFGKDDIDAYGYHVLLGYEAGALPWKPVLSVEYSYASGDGDSTDGTRETFNNVFGSRDRMYGRMNLFDWSNLKDAQINLELAPLDGLKAKGEFHRFWLADKRDGWSLNPKVYRDPSGQAGGRVGRELDILFKYSFGLPQTAFTDTVHLQWGFAHFFPDRFVKKVADDVDANWFFLQLEYALQFGAK